MAKGVPQTGVLYYFKDTTTAEKEELCFRRPAKFSQYEAQNFGQTLVLSVGKGVAHVPNHALFAEALPERVQWESGAVWADGDTLCDPWLWSSIAALKKRARETCGGCSTPSGPLVDLSGVVDSPMKSLADMSGCVKRRRDL